MTEREEKLVLDTALGLADGEVHAVTAYSEDDIRHEYLGENFEENVDQIVLESLIRPIQNVHRSLREAAELNPLGGDHKGSIHIYEKVIYLQIPFGQRDGVIVSLDYRIGNYEEIYAECIASLSD